MILQHRLVRAVLSALLASCLATKAQAVTALGVKVEPACNGIKRNLPQFEQWLGRDVDMALDFLSDQSWKSIGEVGWWTGCWAKVPRVTPVFSLPMLPKGAADDALEQGARGEFNIHFRKVAEQIAASGLKTVVIRLGWEFNGNWYAWRAKGQEEYWRQYWRQIVNSMRETKGITLLFDWCPNIGNQNSAPDLAYPGDQYVDIIGMDVYNTLGHKPPQTRWNEFMNMPFGLKWHADFAKAHGKPISYPEWGTGENRTPNQGGGDDPLFVCHMAAWIKQHDTRYHAYWDETASYDSKLSNGDHPLSGKAYLSEFGPDSDPTRPSALCQAYFK